MHRDLRVEGITRNQSIRSRAGEILVMPRRHGTIDMSITEKVVFRGQRSSDADDNH